MVAAALIPPHNIVHQHRDSFDSMVLDGREPTWDHAKSFAYGEIEYKVPKTKK